MDARAKKCSFSTRFYLENDLSEHVSHKIFVCSMIMLSNLLSCNVFSQIKICLCRLLIFNHILYFEIVKFIGKMRSNGFSPTFSVEQKCESAVQEKYTMCKSLQPSHRIIQSTELENGLAHNSYEHKYAKYCRYSESVPLLYGERISRCSSTSFS